MQKEENKFSLFSITISAVAVLVFYSESIAECNVGENECCSPQYPPGSLSAVSAACSQLQTENVTWKIPETNES